MLYDHATSEQDEELRGLTVVRTGQRQFAEIVRDYLKRITYGDDGWASRVRLPLTSMQMSSLTHGGRLGCRW